ncbi:hypothetical protein ACKKBG_A36035 [Auxenochlorella protothecoides x Auxenochlorella symbiontica]
MASPHAWIAARLGLSLRATTGLFFVVCVASIWVAASFVVQDIQAAGAKPAVLTYIANSLFALYLPLYYFKAWLSGRAGRLAAGLPQDEEERGRLVATRAAPERVLLDGPPGIEGGAQQRHALLVVEEAAPAQITAWQTFNASVVVAPMWYLAQFTFNASLLSTSVTSNTLISSTSVLFTYLLSVALLSERYTLRKLGCIALLILGTAGVALADELASPDAAAARGSLLGDALCLLSALLYGTYTVAIRRMLGEDETTSVLLFFGYMGSIIFVCGAALGLVALLAGAGLGTLTWPVFWAIVAKGLLDNVLSDYLWARAILLIGPTLATAGLSLQIPLAVTADALFRSPAWLRAFWPLVLTAAGGLTILVGFLAMTLVPARLPAQELPVAEMTRDPSPKAPAR